jgi:sugar phosphate permease
MLTLLVRTGPVEFPPWFIALILAVMIIGALVSGLPVTVTMAVIGVRRARAIGRPAGLNGLWYGVLGASSALVGLMAATAIDLPLHWAVPASWWPGLALICLMWQRRVPPETSGPPSAYGATTD